MPTWFSELENGVLETGRGFVGVLDTGVVMGFGTRGWVEREGVRGIGMGKVRFGKGMCEGMKGLGMKLGFWKVYI